jgi:YaiO family outer membrane protein
MLFALGLGAAASADDYWRLDSTQTAWNFSSPNNQYGPWYVTDTRYTNVKPDEAVLAELAYRSDGDRYSPVRGWYASVGYTKDITDRLYVFANAGAGTAQPFPESDFHLEANYKLGDKRDFVMGVAEEVASYFDRVRLDQLQIGPTIYADGGKVVVQAKYLVSANTGSQTRGGALLAFDYSPNRTDKYGVTATAGPETFLVILPGIPTAYADWAATTLTLNVEHAISKHSGVVLALYGARLTTFTRTPVLFGRGASIGFTVR